MTRLGDLWHGRLPLGVAFWTCAVLTGATINVAATVAMMAALAADVPGLIALVIHLSPLPYNVAMVVGVWRSAAWHSASPHHAQTARIAVVVWAMLLSVL